jgi:hypothetical protein
MTIPKVIYLQIVDDEGVDLDPLEDEVTWCVDAINESDVEYRIAPNFYPICAPELHAEYDDAGDIYCRHCGRKL